MNTPDTPAAHRTNDYMRKVSARNPDMTGAEYNRLWSKIHQMEKLADAGRSVLAQRPPATLLSILATLPPSVKADPCPPPTTPQTK